MMCAVLKNWHPMFGVDFHDTIPPPGPVVVPNIPHFVTANLKVGPWGALTGKSRTDILTAAVGETMIRGTDIGPLIPHISSPHYLLPIYILTSASKSEFGATSVMTPDGPVAVAVAVYVNFNLNCHGATRPPLPTGIVIAPTTHMTGFTIGDFVAGLISMALDAAVQYALNRAFGSDRATRFFNWLQGPIIRALCPGARSLTTALLARGMNPYLVTGLSNVVPTIAGLLLGGPIGYDIATIPTADGGKTTPVGAVVNAVNDFLTSPSVPEHSSPPGDYPTPPPGDSAAV